MVVISPCVRRDCVPSMSVISLSSPACIPSYPNPNALLPMSLKIRASIVSVPVKLETSTSFVVMTASKCKCPQHCRSSNPSLSRGLRQARHRPSADGVYLGNDFAVPGAGGNEPQHSLCWSTLSGALRTGLAALACPPRLHNPSSPSTMTAPLLVELHADGRHRIVSHKGEEANGNGTTSPPIWREASPSSAALATALHSSSPAPAPPVPAASPSSSAAAPPLLRYLRRFRPTGGLPPAAVPPGWVLFWSWLVSFLGVLVLATLHYEAVDDPDYPMIIGSFGAQAVLVFSAPGLSLGLKINLHPGLLSTLSPLPNTTTTTLPKPLLQHCADTMIGSPLAQPWNAVFGNTISALVGVVCWKAVGSSNSLDLPYLAAALAVSLAIFV